nr:DUF6517 family protein [Halogeometricum sp. CBA1124]
MCRRPRRALGVSRNASRRGRRRDDDSDGGVRTRGLRRGQRDESPVPDSRRVGGVGGEVTVTGHLAGHSRTVAADRTAALLLVTTPDVRVAGASVNPLRGATDPNAVRAGLALAGRARTLGGVENVTDLREQSVRNVTFLGTTAPLTTYAGVVETDAGRADVRVHVASVEHEGDVVVAVSVHPATMDERDAVSRMLAAAEYRTV